MGGEENEGSEGGAEPRAGRRGWPGRPSLDPVQRSLAAISESASRLVHRATALVKRAPWMTVFTAIICPIVAWGGIEVLRNLVGSEADDSPPGVSPSDTPDRAPASPAQQDGAIEVVSTEVSHSGAGDLWVSDQQIRLDAGELAELDRLEAEDRPGYERQMRAHGAGEVGQENIRAVLQGVHPDGARIMQMTAERECGPPFTGTLFYSPDAGLDPVESAYFDLDSPDPVAQKVNEFNEPVGEFFAGDTYVLEQGEEVVFDIIGATEDQACEFTIEMDVLAGGERSTVSIDDEGAPFRVSGRASAGDYEVAYVGGVVSEGTWKRVDEEIEDLDPWGEELY